MKKIYQSPDAMVVYIRTEKFISVSDGSQTGLNEDDVPSGTGGDVKGHSSVWDDDEDWD